MKIDEIMTPHCQYLSKNDAVLKAARAMADNDIGFVPIGDGDKLVGMLTDRDIVTRGLAAGVDLEKAKVGDIMSDKVYYCYEDDESDKVAVNMGQLQIRRMPVINRDKRLVGVVSLGDLSKKGDKTTAGEALSAISA